ncbi:HPr Serine kinase C-terminal domain-containing protein [Monaibacterium marinum]|uniref:HPr Serine kinase C-terminal domain-containing protein n=1 Tax=Pontivivens marinum TaxID=1690039 RepID=A0A2C9CMS8_9RHOB|nr:HPr kinase/phosphatase C-terminal domain-containing protein [Monaibacterium marinum]SOH92480.1 HPr Serine kinase C-terminal domain-containing protein [Monaibacterium marinum]
MSIHGCVISGPSRAVLILGAAGSGKSSLSLHLLARGAQLVADDRVVLDAQQGRLMASAPSSLHGLIELRGIGIGQVTPAAPAALSLVVDLDVVPLERQPQPLMWQHSGITLRRIAGQGVALLPSFLELWLRNQIDLIDDMG